jgi:glycosyltransferase involved in cell wall biosynthesis
MAKTTIVLPSRNEPYLKNTIDDLLQKSKGDIEIIVILDGWWDNPEKLSDDTRVHYVHFSEPRGMRNGINTGVSLSRGEFIMKADAHCMFGEGFDEILKKDCGENMVIVPRRYPLDPENWKIEKRTDGKYPLDYMYLSTDLHGVVWKEKDLERKDVMIDETPSNQGSCWFMRKDYFNFLELMDEKTYGIFWSEFQEIGLKAWLSGGKCLVNKNTWYAHYHKVGSRGYNLPPGDKENTERVIAKWKDGIFWHKQKYELEPFFKSKFPDMPGW